MSSSEPWSKTSASLESAPGIVDLYTRTRYLHKNKLLRWEESCFFTRCSYRCLVPYCCQIFLQPAGFHTLSCHVVCAVYLFLFMGSERTESRTTAWYLPKTSRHEGITPCRAEELSLVRVDWGKETDLYNSHHRNPSGIRFGAVLGEFKSYIPIPFSWV